MYSHLSSYSQVDWENACVAVLFYLISLDSQDDCFFLLVYLCYFLKSCSFSALDVLNTNSFFSQTSDISK